MTRVKFDNTDLSEFGYSFQKVIDEVPEHDYEEVTIVGKDGTLLIDNKRMNNVQESYDIAIPDNSTNKLDGLRNFLTSKVGYKRLEDDIRPNHYTKARFTGFNSRATDDRGIAVATMNFERVPQRFLKSGDTPSAISTSSESVTGNPVSISNPSGLTSLTGLSLDIQPVQSGEGDPSPTNVRPITGHTSATVTRTGKNLYPIEIGRDTFSNNANGTHSTDSAVLTVNMTTDTDSGIYSKSISEIYKVQKSITGSVVYSFDIKTSVATALLRVGIEERGLVAKTITNQWQRIAISSTFDGSSARAFVVYNRSGQAQTVEVRNFMFELGSEAEDYEPYQSNTYAIDLEDARYGGTLDVLTGVLTVEKESADLGSCSWTYFGSSFPGLFYTDTLRSKIGQTGGNYTHGICSCYKMVPNTNNNGTYGSGTAQPNGTMRFRNTDGRIYIVDERFTDATSLTNALAGETVVFELHDPTTVQITPQQVSLLTGTNIISTDMESMTVTIASPAELENPTLFDSKPLIRVYGNGTLNVNDQYITVANSPYTYIDIDCELMDCYYGSNNANQYVSFSTTDYVTLRSGVNYFSYSGFTKVEVTPRWYEI